MQQQLVAVRIKDGLFVGNQTSSQDDEFLFMNKVSHIINCAGSETPNLYQQANIHYLSFHWRDLPNTLLFDSEGRNVKQIFEFIERGLEKGECVLVHSVLGISRCCAVVAAYLMQKYGWSLDNTVAFMRTAHPDMDIKPYFLRQLGILARRLETEYDIFHPEVDTGKFALDNEQWVLRNTYSNSLGFDHAQNCDMRKEVIAFEEVDSTRKKLRPHRKRITFSDTGQGTAISSAVTKPVIGGKPIPDVPEPLVLRPATRGILAKAPSILTNPLQSPAGMQCTKEKWALRMPKPSPTSLPSQPPAAVARRVDGPTATTTATPTSYNSYSGYQLADARSDISKSPLSFPSSNPSPANYQSTASLRDSPMQKPAEDPYVPSTGAATPTGTPAWAANISNTLVNPSLLRSTQGSDAGLSHMQSQAGSQVQSHAQSQVQSQRQGGYMGGVSAAAASLQQQRLGLEERLQQQRVKQEPLRMALQQQQVQTIQTQQTVQQQRPASSLLQQYSSTLSQQHDYSREHERPSQQSTPMQQPHRQPQQLQQQQIQQPQRVQPQRVQSQPQRVQPQMQQQQPTPQQPTRVSQSQSQLKQSSLASSGNNAGLRGRQGSPFLVHQGPRKGSPLPQRQDGKKPSTGRPGSPGAQPVQQYTPVSHVDPRGAADGLVKGGAVGRIQREHGIRTGTPPKRNSSPSQRQAMTGSPQRPAVKKTYSSLHMGPGSGTGSGRNSPTQRRGTPTRDRAGSMGGRQEIGRSDSYNSIGSKVDSGLRSTAVAQRMGLRSDSTSRQSNMQYSSLASAGYDDFSYSKDGAYDSQGESLDSNRKGRTKKRLPGMPQNTTMSPVQSTLRRQGQIRTSSASERLMQPTASFLRKTSRS